MNIPYRLITCLVLFGSCLQAFSQLTLEDIFLKGKYYTRTLGDATFLHQTDQYALLKNSSNGDHIVIYDAKTHAVDSIVINSFSLRGVLDLPEINYESVEASNSDKYFLLKANEEKLYRRSGAANYFIADHSGKISQLSSGKLSFPKFSSDDNKIAYVKYNNLYWYDVEENSEHAITTDGAWNSIINGKSDWVYEEELELTRAFDWNNSGDKIAYLKFDESRVKEYTIPIYYGQTYPFQFSYKYPLVGEENSKVSVWVYDVKKDKSIPVKISGYHYEYIPRIYWNATGDEVWIMLLNRHQDSLTVAAYNINTKKIRTVYEDHSDTYVDVPFAFDILNDNSFIVNSERDGYSQLYHFDLNGKLIQQLTKGNFEVTDYYGTDEKNRQVYFQSNEDNVIGRKIYSINYQNLQKQNYSKDGGTNDAAFSPDYHFYFNSNSSASSPNTIKIFYTDQAGSALVEDNTEVRARYSNYPQKEFIKIPVNGVELEAWMMKPENFDPNKKYPLLMSVYGGPGNQEVLDKWGGAGSVWFSYLAQEGYVVACVDNRGSGGKGAVFKKGVYLNLGKLETEDQIAAAKYFSSMSFIDSSRIGICGASYGGYMAALCLLEGNSVFNTAIVQSPVTDWKLYDDIYTERYMRTPEENKKGYENYNPVMDAAKLKGNLLLIHGTADDNVHFQNSIEFIDALNDAHKTYNLYIYPDKSHGRFGTETYYDLYLKITQFLKEKL